MAGVRDSQRSRVYKAEHFLYAEGKTTRFDFKRGLTPKSSIHDCDSYIGIVAEQFWFRQRWGDREFLVQSGRGGGKAFGSRRITLGTWARNEAVCLHEMAHCLAPNGVKHGAEFAGVYIFLVKNVFGKEMADKLRASFKENKVRYNYKAIPAINKNVKTHKQKNVEARRKFKAEKTRVKQTLQAPLLPSERKVLVELLTRSIKSGALGETGSPAIIGARRVVRAVSKVA